ncbi:extracellular exo-polygalacturonase-like protein [Paraphoma chrysanthemicola]|uniref:galacturonan 1,4-alpha-galacturonidase n=1 Tax=Paraphoma chrysanthemicola TaxID=798071 RepID=A0A8K0VTL4_9PLEO|nr:extracellular exo-polygalacturonase-like protein [Paraphoma chrysanthemicola]
MVKTSASLLVTFSLLNSFVSSASTTENFLSTLRSPRPFHAVRSPLRNRTCVALSNNNPSVDDAPNILEAIKECDQGGHVIFAEKLTYTIDSPLNLTGLSAIDIDIQGELSFTDNMTSWQKNAFDLQYQNATSFFMLGGQDVNVYGHGEVQGNGQAWWDAYPENKKLKRPVLFAIVGLHGGSVSQIKLRNSPFWHNIIANSSNVVYSGLDLFSSSNNGNFEKNTDGWDIYRSDSIVIENSTITNGDDCVSFKPNSTNILVQNLRCNGTHGISVGSLGQYPARVDYVENILVRNILMANSSEGARIKVWPDAYSEKSQSLTGGGGRGLVRNVTWDGMFLDNVDYGLTITQCYGMDDEEECFKHPSKLNITDITFRNIRGRTNRVFSPIVAHLVCSSPHTCSGILAENVDIRTVNGSNLVTCRNVDKSTLGGLNCTDWSKGYNPA